MQPSFGAEYFFFQFVVQKYKDEGIHNFVCCFVWVWNLVVHI